jgi:hypothetical protein
MMAERVSADLVSKMGVNPVLTDVGRGRFEVVVEGRTIFSKAELGRFPHHGEIVRLLRAGK